MQQGATAIAAWRDAHPGERLHLAQADLAGANLRGANLHGAHLQEANLQRAYLVGTDLGGADLRGAYLERVDLQWANLQETILRGARLQAYGGMVAEHQPPAAWLVDPVQAHHLRQHVEGAATALRLTYDVSLRSEPPDVPLPLTVAERLRHLRQLVGNALHDL